MALSTGLSAYDASYIVLAGKGGSDPGRRGREAQEGGLEARADRIGVAAVEPARVLSDESRTGNGLRGRAEAGSSVQVVISSRV